MRTISDGDRWHGPDWSALATAFENGTVVLSGCLPTKGTGDSVDVASGTVTVTPTGEDDTTSVSSGNVSLSSRSGFTRFDLVTVQSDGSLNNVTGTAELEAPFIPSSECLLAIVEVPDSSSGDAITVKDARIIMSDVFLAFLNVNNLDANTAKFDTLDVTNLHKIPTKSSDPGSPGTAELWYRSDLD